MATNDLIILLAFVPIVKFLLGVSKVSVPWDTLILSVVLFVVIPPAGGILTRVPVTKRKGANYFELSVAVAIALFGTTMPSGISAGLWIPARNAASILIRLAKKGAGGGFAVTIAASCMAENTAAGTAT